MSRKYRCNVFFFYESFRLQDLVEGSPLMPLIKKSIFIKNVQSPAAVMKIAKFILHSIHYQSKACVNSLGLGNNISCIHNPVIV